MATPVLEDIAEQIVTRLEAGTYAFPLLRVIRPNRLQTNKTTLEHLECYVIQGEPQRNTENDIGGNPPALGWTVPYAVIVQIRPSDKDETALDTYFNTISADVVKALADADDWHIWNNKAVNTDYSIAMAAGDDHSSIAAIVTLSVDVRLDWIDPYTAR